MTSEFVGVTEIEGQKISREQLDRICHRYHWAALDSQQRSVLEVGCGAGQGLRLLARQASELKAGDYSPEVLATALENFPDLDLSVFAAESLPFADQSFDRVLLFEAIYYVDAEEFFREAWRVLKPGGVLLMATANKDLFDFVPSPFARRYLGAAELADALGAQGYAVELFGYLDANSSTRQRILRPVKALASRLGLIPKTMHGKEFFKKLFFGEMCEMPAEISAIPFEFHPPAPISASANFRYKVIYSRAGKPMKG